MRHNTNDSRASERLPDGKHTYSGKTDICCADEATTKERELQTRFYKKSY
ncbi:MAG: hypothetical protein ABJG37_20750 [Ekhidna sp.]